MFVFLYTDSCGKRVTGEVSRQVCCSAQPQENTLPVCFCNEMKGERFPPSLPCRAAPHTLVSVYKKALELLAVAVWTHMSFAFAV